MRKRSLLVVLVMLASIFFLSLSFISNVRATTLYVGGGGPGNYSLIQAAVDDASPGDIVYVYGGLYPENLVIDKALSLIGEDRETTTVNGGATGDVIEASADWVNVSGFTITNSGSGFTDGGVDFSFTSNCRLASSNVSANGFRGIILLNARNTTIQDNTISENTLGISLESAYDARIIGNGISMSGAGWGGIYLEYSHNNTILNNTISGGDDGITLIFSDGNTVSESTISDTWRGIYLSHSSGNSITLSNISLSSNKAISVDSSQGNIISLNTVFTNFHGIHLENSDGNDIIDNTALANDMHGIYLFESENNRVLRNNALSNLESGIHFVGPGPNTFGENTVRLNQIHGMYFELSGASVITNNTIEENADGIYVQFSWFNQIYHNSFINNTLQAHDDGDTNQWDKGYPSGGNYWSDYAGVDQKSGPNQSEGGSDGIGDTPYDISGGTSQDRYPFEKPTLEFNNPPTASFTVTPPEGNTTTVFIMDASTSSDPEDTITSLEFRWDCENDGMWDDFFMASQCQYSMPGTYTILLEVRDTWGRTNSTTRQVIVGAIENQHPTCSISEPEQSDVLSGDYTVRGTASDTDGVVEEVEIRIDDGPWIQVTGTSSWSYVWNTTNVSDGNHTIYARSYDGTNYSEEVSVTVRVDNVIPPPPAEEESIFEQAWFWIAVAVVIMITLLAVFVLTRRGKEKQGEGESPESG